MLRPTRLGLSHWDPYAVPVYYCNMVEWCWLDSSLLIWKTNWLPSVLWHCWFGHMTVKSSPIWPIMCWVGRYTTTVVTELHEQSLCHHGYLSHGTSCQLYSHCSMHYELRFIYNSHKYDRIAQSRPYHAQGPALGQAPVTPLAFFLFPSPFLPRPFPLFHRFYFPYPSPSPLLPLKISARRSEGTL